MRRFVLLLTAVMISSSMVAKGDKSDKEITATGNLFALSLLDRISSSSEEDIIVISPLSASYALSMAANGAKGETYGQILEAMHSEGLSVTELNDYCSRLTSLLMNADTGIELGIANSLWISDELKVRRRFSNSIKRFFDGESAVLDFKDPQSPGLINKWCADKTEGRVDRVIDNIDPSDMMFIINALYFKGGWSSPFDSYNTAEGTFHGTDGDNAGVPFMRQKEGFYHGSGEGYSMVELPYGEGRYAMDIILPDHGISTNDLMKRLDPAEIFSSLSYGQVAVTLPKFKADFKTLMNDPLKEMGMELPFTSAADFSGISRTPLFISSVIQKSFIEVNEAGSEAAAVTVIGMCKTSLEVEKPFIFNVDRPFIFMIREKTSGAVLFSGVVRNL